MPDKNASRKFSGGEEIADGARSTPLGCGIHLRQQGRRDDAAELPSC